MRYYFLPTFNRRFKKLPNQKQECIFTAVESLKYFYQTRRPAAGLGLKNLRGNFWEIRASLQDRIVFSLEEDIINFVLIGSHDEVRRFLKNR